ncbi:MAG: D-alanyl-D-alanine carboxypeptidase family protein [Clostridia bacterium]|nr:D-alanyl-D-alanine carboxypeptidase family protein [Clostridia bacterium]
MSLILHVADVRPIRRALIAGFAAVCILLSWGTAGRTAPATVGKPTGAGQELTGKITAPSAILVEPSTGRVLWEKNADVSRPIASVVKVMTLTLVMEALDAGTIRLDDPVTASEHVVSMGGSQIWLESGETMPVSELIKAVAIESANDAAVALAELVAGSEESFVSMMNEKARSLGCTNTSFVNATGLPGATAADDCTSSAHDVALISRELLKHSKIHEWLTVWIGYVRDGKNMLTNTNRLIRFYPGADGLKTGFTERAKYCLSATAMRNGVRVIAVVLGVPTSAVRFAEASLLLDYGFRMCEAHTLAVAGQEIGTIRVCRGTLTSVPVSVREDVKVVTQKGSESKIEARLSLPQSVDAPVSRGQAVGRLVATVDGEETVSVDLVASTDAPRARFATILVRSTRELFRSVFIFGR